MNYSVFLGDDAERILELAHGLFPDAKTDREALTNCVTSFVGVRNSEMPKRGRKAGTKNKIKIVAVADAPTE